MIYEYQAFEVTDQTVGGTLKILNIIGKDGWIAYHQCNHEKGLLVFAYREKQFNITVSESPGNPAIPRRRTPPPPPPPPPRRVGEKHL